MATRKIFVEANSQQRPEERWLVIGEPSRGILMLKVCVSLMAVEREVMMEDVGFEESAASARRFFAVAISFILDVMALHTGINYFGIFHEFLLPLLGCGNGDILLVWNYGCVFRSYKKGTG